MTGSTTASPASESARAVRPAATGDPLLSVQDIVVDQGRGVNHLRDGGQGVVCLGHLAAGPGCRKTESAPTATASVSSDILAGYHFAGTASLAGNSNASKLREIWALPETGKFQEQTLQKLAHAPKVLYGDKINAEQDERGAALLRPLLDDLIRSESFLQVRGTAIKQAEWTLLAQLPPDRLKAWSAALSELTRLWNLGAPTAS